MYKVQFTKGKITASAIKRDREDAKKYPKETWRAKQLERLAAVDCFYNFESVCMECHGGSSGPCSHEEIIEMVECKLRDWIKRDWHWSEPNDDFWNHNQNPKYLHKVKHRPITRSSVYFRCDFPKVLDREGFFRILAELKGAKKDSTGGLWKK